jgi:chromosome segregation ATPase
MRATIIGVVVLIAFTAGGCGERKRLEGELTQAKVQIQALDSTLAQAKSNTDNLTDSLRTVGAAIQQARRQSDSLERSYQIVTAKTRKLEKTLKSARADYQKSLDSLQTVRLALESTIQTQKTKLDDAETQLTNLQQDIDRVSEQKDSVYAVINRVRPWLDYYRQEAGRSWIKKLFGAGRAAKPTMPEPSLTPNFVPHEAVETP